MEKQIWHSEYLPETPTDISQELAKHNSVYEIFETAFREYPHRTAISFPILKFASDLTFSDLEVRVNRFALYLQETLGLKKGDRFIIMLPNVPQFAVAFLAAQKLGLTCINTNPLYTPDEMRHQFKDCGAESIIILDLLIDKLEKILPETKIKHVIKTSIGDELAGPTGLLLQSLLHLKKQVPAYHKQTFESLAHFSSYKDIWSLKTSWTFRGKQAQTVACSHDDIALLQYTGGTTGKSKGAMITQKNILANVLQIHAIFRAAANPPHEVILTALPLYHIFALTVNFLAFTSLGCRNVFVPRPIPIENSINAIRKYRTSIVTGVNTLYNAMVAHKDFQKMDTSFLKVAIAGGMALQESVRKRWMETTGIQCTQGYGLTEASPVTHFNPLGKEYPTGSIGNPLPSTKAYVVDDNENLVSNGTIGELCIEGPQVMKGYWKGGGTENDLEGVFTKQGWLKTGDLGYQDDRGYFFIVDRKKDLIIVSGFNVYPNEIEDVISQHPKVLEVAVVGIESEQSGEQVKCFVVKKDESLTEEELRKFCKTKLTNYKVPKQYEFREELPKTNVGKILRRELVSKSA